MSWKVKSRKRLVTVFIAGFFLLLLLGLFSWQRLQNKATVKGIETTVNNSKTTNQKKEPEISYSEVSPDGLKQIILYEMPFNGENQLEYYSYLSNQFIFAVKELDSSKERYIFVNDYKTGNPHWLGNEHIFFTSGCGTGCQGLYLVNTDSKETRLSLLTVIPVTKDSFETHFRDWFDQEFKFPGWTKHIRSVLLENKVYLIFQMWNNGQPAGEKRFLFSKNELKEE